MIFSNTITSNNINLSKVKRTNKSTGKSNYGFLFELPTSESWTQFIFIERVSSDKEILKFHSDFSGMGGGDFADFLDVYFECENDIQHFDITDFEWSYWSEWHLTPKDAETYLR